MKLFAVSLAAAFLMQQSMETLKVDVRLQQVIATVRDESGKIVKGLHKEDFIIEDGRMRQDIVHFSDDPDATLSLAILIDTTGSMGKMPGGTESGVAAAAGITQVLLHYLKPDDEVSVMTFSTRFEVKQNFTSDRRKIEEAIAGLQIDGMMDVLNAIGPALAQTRKARYAKRALIVMTDAYFSGELKQVANAVSRAEVPVFTFALRGVDFGPRVQYCTSACHAFETLPPLQDPRHGAFIPNHTQPFLDTMANESGGRSTIFELDPRNTLVRINAQIEDIAAELRGQYLLGYYPGTASSGTIRVRSTNPSYRVHFRREGQLLSK